MDINLQKKLIESTVVSLENLLPKYINFTYNPINHKMYFFLELMAVLKLLFEYKRLQI